MVIHFGEPEVLERHVPELLDCIVGRKFTRSDLLEKTLQFCCVHVNSLASVPYLLAARTAQASYPEVGSLGIGVGLLEEGTNRAIADCAP